ncbi:glycosyltransferase [Dyadobacter pollutisoli]|uniref:Glycosyltransferase n=1 Tax=Dyadobacter pollutisoli TaxID=2910158 RepID=A0A9E8SMT7_9BACT|nr:glycosyltransferase [Dyadobacter pollutisoli]WAC15120.1 glycosyltransferase [Dyadobacter pollutisoli]
MIEQYLLSWLLPVIVVFIVSYAIFTLWLTYFWNKIKSFRDSAVNSPDFISVIIPVRNEEENIGALLQDLAHQSFSFSQFEVLVMDDSSTDNTAKVVNDISQHAACNIRLISLPDIATSSPKKRAIETAIGSAKGNLIVTTDGDCRVQPGWLQAIATCHKVTGARLISAPVTFSEETSLTDHLQTVEFASLIGSGASAISAGYPSLCNGANLTYEKAAFLAVDGFDGVRHIASGDDEFLMHKIAAKYPGSIHFLKNPQAVVSTSPHKNWAGFFRQRKRWASKWKHYQSRTPLILALYIFMSNFSFLLTGPLLLSGHITLNAFLILAALKCLPEWLFLGTVLQFLQKPKSVWYIPVTQVFYPFYVCFFGLVAQQSEYMWKGRKLV